MFVGVLVLALRLDLTAGVGGEQKRVLRDLFTADIDRLVGLAGVSEALAPGKTNVLLWGDSLAAHYYDGLGKIADAHTVHILQATQAACMPTLNTALQGNASCRSFAGQIEAFFRDRKPIPW